MKNLIISLGGSIICPDKPDYFFLREFKNFIIRHFDKHRFIIVCGGGKTNSLYNDSAQRVSNVKKEDLDWIGIMSTRLNAELVRVIFSDLAHYEVIYDPNIKIESEKKIIIAAGWKPGCSTDYSSVLLAKQFEVEEIINLTNTSYVYDKDPKKFKDAEKLLEVKWEDYRKLIASTWKPRLNTPFDPIASKEAENLNLKVVILKGTDLSNVENYLEGKSFTGTVIY